MGKVAFPYRRNGILTFRLNTRILRAQGQQATGRRLKVPKLSIKGVVALTGGLWSAQQDAVGVGRPYSVKAHTGLLQSWTAATLQLPLGTCRFCQMTLAASHWG